MTINYIITKSGIIVVKAGKEASALLRQMGLSMGDDLAKLFNQYDDAKSLADGAHSLLNADGAGLYKVIGTAAFSAGVAAGIALGWPVIAASAGGTAAIVGTSWVLGKVYEMAFDSATAAGKWWSDYWVDEGVGEISVSFGGNENFPLLMTTTTYADGSYKISLYDDVGQSTTSDYTANGRMTHKSWQNADGSRGDTQYRADGSSSGIVVRADGSYQRFADDGKGTSVLIQYDANGNQTRQQWHNADGSYGAEYTDPNGQRHGTAPRMHPMAVTVTTPSTQTAARKAIPSIATAALFPVVVVGRKSVAPCAECRRWITRRSIVLPCHKHQNGLHFNRVGKTDPNQKFSSKMRFLCLSR